MNIAATLARARAAAWLVLGLVLGAFHGKVVVAKALMRF